MDFLLKSEVLTRDVNRGHLKRTIYCPFCNKSQIRKIEEHKYYSKYKCWNKHCDTHEPFIVVKDFIEKEEFFNLVCDFCGEPFHRNFEQENGSLHLKFECQSKLCGSYDGPLLFNLTKGKWENKKPKFKVYDDQIELISSELKQEDHHIENLVPSELPENSQIDSKRSLEEKSIQSSQENTSKGQLNVKMPLLNMDQEQYTSFLDLHNGKVIILVDVPNFIRTLHDYYPIHFQEILKKAYDLLIYFIDNYYRVSENYLIRYFSKPDDDLMRPNQFLMDKCRNNREAEFFHLLKIDKKGHFSDIDNYLITNAVEILERCDIKGFSIVSSDKDYLPVMRIADYKGIRSCILGINTSDIYQKYNIGDIKFLNVLNYFEA
jgi:uncharacterized LabA/DUF88 family protein